MHAHFKEKTLAAGDRDFNLPGDWEFVRNDYESKWGRAFPMPRGDEQEFIFSSGPVEVRLEPMQHTTDCKLVQAVFERTNFPVRGREEVSWIDNDPDYGPNQNNRGVDYDGNRFTDWPFMRPSNRGGFDFKSGPLWAVFQAHVFVQNIPQIEAFWGFSGSAAWDPRRGTFVVGRGRWRDQDRRPEWRTATDNGLNTEGGLLVPDLLSPVPTVGELFDFWEDS